MPTHSLKAILVTLYSISLFSIQAQNIAQDSLISRKYEELNLLNESGAFEEMILTGEAFRDSIVLEDSLSLPYARLMFMIGTGYYNYGADISVMEAPLLTALKIFRRHQDIGTVKVLNRLGECHVWYTGDFNTAIGYLDEALKAHADLSDDCSSVLSTVYQSRGLLFTYAADYESAYESYKHSLDCKITSKDSARIFLGLGDFFFQQGLYAKALEYHSESAKLFIKVYPDNPNHPNLGACYANQGLCYQHMGAYAKAIIYFEKARQIFTTTFDATHTNTLRVINSIGSNYFSLQEYDKAIAILEGLLQTELIQEPEELTNLLEILATCYAYQGKTDIFLRYMDKYVALLDTAAYKYENHKFIALRNAGLRYSNGKQDSLSQVFYHKALEFSKTMEAVDAGNMNLIYMDMAYYFLDRYKLDSARYYFELALKKVMAGRDTRSYEYYYLAFGLAHTLKRQYQQNQDGKLLDRAIDLMEDAVKCILYFRSELVESQDKILLNFEAHDVFEHLINFLQLKQKSDQNNDQVKRCFVLAEQNKSSLLLESVRWNHAGFASDLADSLRYSRQLLAKIQQQINAAISSDSVNLNYFRNRYFETEQQFDELSKLLKDRYPNHYNTIFKAEIKSVDSLKAAIRSEDHAILEYFCGDSSITIFVLRSDTLIMEIIKRDFDLESWVSALRFGIYGYFTSGKQHHSLYEQTMESYLEYGPKLWDRLIKPVEKWLKGKITIVADGPLTQLPFDALLEYKPTSLNNFGGFPYLWKKHQLSYAYSTTALMAMRDKKHLVEPENNLLALAPFTHKTENKKALELGLKMLPGSLNEITHAREIIGNGEALSGKRASKKFFYEHASSYRYIHLSAHAHAGLEKNNDVWLALSESLDSVESGLLKLSDLYSMKLNADMIVLSACETGLGKVLQGEGAISLARAFAFAGAKSVVTTLWSVENTSTSKLMAEFYNALANGKEKDEAMKLAREEYLKNVPASWRHPFFWLGIIVIGDTSPISMH